MKSLSDLALMVVPQMVDKVEENLPKRRPKLESFQKYHTQCTSLYPKTARTILKYSVMEGKKLKQLYWVGGLEFREVAGFQYISAQGNDFLRRNDPDPLPVRLRKAVTF